MSQYPIPPWFQQPNPVDTYQHGLAIGSQIGAEQAAQEFKRRALEHEAAKEALNSEIQHAKLSLGVEAQAAKNRDIARRYAAQQEYQDLLRAGVDPDKALLQVGPKMGINGAALARLVHETTPFGLNVTEKDGEKYLQTGPQSFAHVARPRMESSRMFKQQDGTIIKVNPDGTAETVVKGTPKPLPKARYTYKKENGDTITGTVDDPEIARLVGLDKQKRDEEEAAKMAEAQQPGVFQRMKNMIFGGGATPIPPSPMVTPKKYSYDRSTGTIVPVQEEDDTNAEPAE